MTAAQPSLNRKTFASLTGLRAVAAALVFFFHWFFTHAGHLPLAVRGPFDIGYVGVPIFFALSGFLITLRYGAEFVDISTWDRRRFWAYYRRRVVRIVPLYLFVLIFFLFAFGRPKNMMPDDGRQTAILLTLTQAFFVDTRLIGTTVGWTLTLEMAYYALAPFLVRFAGLKAPLWAIAGRILLLLALGFGLAALLAWVPAGDQPRPLLAGEPLPLIIHYSLFGQLGAFLFGQLAATTFLNPQARQRLRAYPTVMTTAAAIALYGTMLWLATDTSELGGFPNHALVLLIALLAAVLILGLALAEETGRPSLISVILGSRLLVYLGLVSYALYLVQLTEPVQWIYWVGLGEYGGIEDQVWRALVLYVVVTLLSLLLYELVEKPLHRRLSRRRARS